MHRLVLPIVLLTAVVLSLGQPSVRADSPFALDLPTHAVSDRVSITRGIGSNESPSTNSIYTR